MAALSRLLPSAACPAVRAAAALCALLLAAPAAAQASPEAQASPGPQAFAYRTPPAAIDPKRTTRAGTRSWKPLFLAGPVATTVAGSASPT